LSPASTALGKGVAFSVWTGVAAFYALVLHLHEGVTWVEALAAGALEIYTLAVLMVGVARLTPRLAARFRGSALVAAHLALGLTVLVVWRVLIGGFLRLVLGPAFWELVYAGSWGFQLLGAVATYGTALGVVLAIHAARREREQERRAAAFELAAREAELSAIKGQLQPHFLMNALNSILASIDDDPERARELLLGLAAVLHSVFERMDEDFVPLARELDFVSSYLAIERVRFGERLSVSIDADAALGSALVPPFLLQPLVENAVKHGVAPSSAPGVVEVRAEEQQGGLLVSVTDSGRGFAGEAPLQEGRGLSLTRRRLQAVYGDGARLSLARRGGRFSVELHLPLRHDGDGAHAPAAG
jgi:two-component system, LytTR family, sensor kinase